MKLEVAKQKIADAIATVKVFCNVVEWDKPQAKIWIDGEIGQAMFGLIDAASVRKALKAIGNQRVTVFLSSPGGSVDEGVSVYNALVSHKPGVDIVVESLAASMGSYILQAGRRRIVYENAIVMLHSPWSGTIGDAEQLRKDAEILDKYGERLKAAYADRSGKTISEIEKLMNAETWLVGRQIVDEGFADYVTADGENYETPATSRAASYPIRTAAKSRSAMIAAKTCLAMR